MSTPHQTSLPVAAPAQSVFQSALGIVLNTKSMEILAVHNEGMKLVALGKSKMSNSRIYTVAIEDLGGSAVLHLTVGADPRMRSAVLDGKLNQKAAANYVESVTSAVSGQMQAPITPVPNHYMQKKNQVPWNDPNTEPDIQLGFSWLGAASKWR